MNKKSLLKLIASAGYDVGFGAKKHFATFDVIEKAPGWLGLVSLVGGIYSLFVPFWGQAHATAAFVVFGVVALYVGLYGSDKTRYEEAGKAMTKAFHDLHALYRTVESLPDGADVTQHEQALKTIRDGVLEESLSKQIFLSDWYAHYKFFWQTQIDWIDRERPFRFFRDKVPLSTYIVIVLALAVAGLVQKNVIQTGSMFTAAVPTTASSDCRNIPAQPSR